MTRFVHGDKDFETDEFNGFPLLRVFQGLREKLELPKDPDKCMCMINEEMSSIDHYIVKKDDVIEFVET